MAGRGSLGQPVTRGDVFLADVGTKLRPVLILTRPEVIDVRANVTVAEISTTIRGLAVEVELDAGELGLSRASVVNCDGLHTIDKRLLTTHVGSVDQITIDRVCEAVTTAIGC